MKITVSDRASKWFHEDMGLDDGRGVRFYGKVYGKTPVHDGFSLALTPDDHPERFMPKPRKTVLRTGFRNQTNGSLWGTTWGLTMIQRLTVPNMIGFKTMSYKKNSYPDQFKWFKVTVFDFSSGDAAGIGSDE